MRFTVPWWAGLSFAVLEELWWPSGAHTQALVCCLPGLLVEADDDGLLHTWDETTQLMPKNREVFLQGSFKLCVPYPPRVKAKMQNTLYVSISHPHVHMEHRLLHHTQIRWWRNPDIQPLNENKQWFNLMRHDEHHNGAAPCLSSGLNCG